MNNENERCKNCYFGDTVSRHIHAFFICRFNAPQKVHGVGTGENHEIFPKVDQHRDWCGQWTTTEDDEK